MSGELVQHIDRIIELQERAEEAPIKTWDARNRTEVAESRVVYVEMKLLQMQQEF